MKQNKRKNEVALSLSKRIASLKSFTEEDLKPVEFDEWIKRNKKAYDSLTDADIWKAGQKSIAKAIFDELNIKYVREILEIEKTKNREHTGTEGELIMKKVLRALSKKYYPTG